MGIKMKAIVEETKNVNVTSLAGVPSWMLVTLQRIIADSGADNLLDIWPHAEVYFHGGVSFEPYSNQYNNLFPSENFKYLEIYNASEGFFALQDQNDSDELLLMLDYGIFYEFIPMDTFGTDRQNAIPLSAVEIGKNYAVVITTNSGLWRYLIGDTVRFKSTKPYRKKITATTKHNINVFGEELMIENTDTALARTAKDFGVEIVDYTVAPIFMQEKEKGAHEWIIEFKNPPENIDMFTKELDINFQKINSDYEAKRYNNMTLNQLKLNIAHEQLFFKWLQEQGKLGGQNKIPRLSNDRYYIEQLLKLNQ